MADPDPDDPLLRLLDGWASEAARGSARAASELDDFLRPRARRWGMRRQTVRVGGSPPLHVRLLSEAESHDVAQQAIVTLLEKLRAGAFDPKKGKVMAYFFSLWQGVRLQHERGKTTDELPEMADPGLGADERLAIRTCHERCSEELRSNNAPQHEVYVLDIEGQSPADIAHSLGISRNNAYVRFSRARAFMRACMADCLGGSHG